jgi:hypothetical protein
MAHSKLVFQVYQTVPGGNITGRMEIPIQAQTLPTDVGTLAAAIAALFGGDDVDHLSSGGILASSYLTIPLGVSVSPVEGEIRNAWGISYGQVGSPNTFSIPSRATTDALLVAGSHGTLGDLSASAFDALTTALTGTAGVRIVDPTTDTAISLTSEFYKARSTVSKRQRPRV